MRTHGGVEGISKLRSSQVTYRMKGSIPGAEQLGAVDVTIIETYDLPKVKKQIEGIQGQTHFEVSWAVLGDKYWYRENRGQVRWTNQNHDTENMARPYLILEGLPKLLSDGSRLSLGETSDDSRVLVHANPKGLRDQTHAYWFDKTTGLLVRSRSPAASPEGPVEQENEFSGYQSVDGLELFMAIKSFRKGRQVAEFEVSNVRFLRKPGDDLFAPPEDVLGRKTDLPKTKESVAWEKWLMGLAVVLFFLGAVVFVRNQRSKYGRKAEGD